MLKYRLITAAILIPITLVFLFLSSQFFFCIFTGIIVLLAAWEWSHLIEIAKHLPRLLYLLVMVVGMLAVTFLIPMTWVFFCAFIWWLLATALIILYPRGSAWWKQGVFWRGLMGLLVLIPCWVAMVYIRSQPDGIEVLLFLFILIWNADTAAYFVGKKWGKHKLLLQVSPGKSWQGLAGALLGSLLLVLLTLWLCNISSKLWLWAVALSLITVVFSIIGDLFESMLKRVACLKDSGALLPGHGGLLDRIDSLTAAVPVFAFGAMMLGRYL